MKFIVISDTHSLHRKITVPEGDVLIHAGDFTGHLASQEKDLVRFNAWLGTLPHRYKVLVPGNHDKLLQTDPVRAKAMLSNAMVLIDEEVTLDGIRIYGSPWTPTFLNWYFMQPRGRAIAAKWAKIPEGLDILVTHGPPHGILDTVSRYSAGMGDYIDESVGCEKLLARVRAVKPRAHVFGHIHGGAGDFHSGGTYFVNASICNEGYRPIQPVRVFELRPRTIA